MTGGRIRQLARMAGGHRCRRLPVAVIMPTPRCNCRCAMCGFWQPHGSREELSRDDVETALQGFSALGAEQLVVSGGEPLLYEGLWQMCCLARKLGMRVAILTNGLDLEKQAAEVARHADDLFVSLDGPEPVHDRIRGVPGAFARLRDGIGALREHQPDFPVRARCTLQRANLPHFEEAIHAAAQIGLDGISFLAVDVQPGTFNRESHGATGPHVQLLPAADAVAEYRTRVRALRERSPDLPRPGFVAEKRGRLLALADYFDAARKDELPVAPPCNAPWHAVVVESDGAVRPCFFQPPYGNIHDAPLAHIVNGPDAIAFRKHLRMAENPVCRRCVCPLIWRGARRRGA